MNDAPTPETPWWSQPGTTVTLPDTEPAAPPPPVYDEPVAPPRRRRRLGTPVLLALALVAGGAAGGGVAEYFHDDSGTTLISTTPLASGTVKNGTSTIAGTPESAAAIIGPSVVTIEVTGQQSSGFGVQTVSDTGSGVIIRDSGYILTNNHVVAAAVGGGSVHVTLADGTTVPARIVGTDSTTDLAVIKIDGQSGLKAATFAPSETLKVGQAVIAVGAPLGLSNTVTEGIVSTLHRPVQTGDSSGNSQAVIDAVQTDAAINPGNSGGALVDLGGRVVGINSAIASTGSSGSGQSGNIGVGFAIPSETATKVADQLISKGRAVHSQIGVNVGSSDSSDGTPGTGATIRGVTSGSPAAKAGLQAGDVVTKVNDRQITDATSLIAAIRSYDPGTTVTLTLVRAGATKTVRVTLASAQDS
ncbi:MAG: S1C family serine protease [Mycobacteriales bacterium]